MEQDIIQEVADLTLPLIPSHPRYAEITNRAYNTLTDLTIENNRLKQELEVAQKDSIELSWIKSPDRMGK